MTGKGAGSDVRANINITPLIDIVLVLLIVFIVLVPGFVRVLPVAVPGTELRPPGQVRPEVLVVTLDGQGRLFLQREELALAALGARLIPAVLLQPLGERKVFLKVAGDLPHARAVGVLDEIRQASLEARRRTRARAGFQELDGGEIRVAVALLKEG
jgi:biopolymer transport protein ExbD